MSYYQWERAMAIIDLMEKIEKDGCYVSKSRKLIKNEIEKKFNNCHGCLLLAVYGFYKNGYIAGTDCPVAKEIDYDGFDGKFSENIRHAFNALDELNKNPDLSANKLKQKFGGDYSIYSFVQPYFTNGWLKKTRQSAIVAV